jgi:hypothetical protein
MLWLQSSSTLMAAVSAASMDPICHGERAM